MSERIPPPPPPEEQQVYARLLAWGARLGFAILLVGLANYVVGFLPHHVPVEELPRLWSLPLPEYLARTATPTGWRWVVLLAKGEFPGLAGIALLSGCSVACLVAVAAIYARRGDRIYAAICALEIAVLVLAASGVLTAGH